MSQVLKMTEFKTSSSSSFIYFDFNATTPPSVEVASRLSESIESWGNPSSIHAAGRKPKLLLREARTIISKALGCHPLEMVFTSGGSESNNTVIQSVLEDIRKRSQEPAGAAANIDSRDEFITSAVEHPSVMKTMMHIRELGFTVHVIPVGRDGQLDLDFFKAKLSKKTALVSVMFANNETGNLLPVEEITKLAHQAGALVHTDAVQALGKVEIDLHGWGVDYASFSGHKFYALKGVGVLYQKRGAPLNSLILGGAQERHRRGGTENVMGIHSLRVMCESISEIPERTKKILMLRNYLEAEIIKRIPAVQVTGGSSPRLANTSSLIISGVDGETLLMSLDLQGFAVSTGAACSSGNPEPSPVLLAMGLSKAEAQNSLRLSLGWSTTAEEIESFVTTLSKSVERLRSFSTSSLEPGVYA
jgi:cysteine desulfurase